MKTPKFLLGFLLVVALSYAKSQLTEYWVPIEFSFFLIFFVIKSSDMMRVLTFTFILSFGLDLILQTAQVKGLGCMSQLILVYAVMLLKRHVVPNVEDLFLLGTFALFYFANYYVYWGLSSLFGVYFNPIPFGNLVFLSLFHTAIFGLILVIGSRFKRGEK